MHQGSQTCNSCVCVYVCVFSTELYISHPRPKQISQSFVCLRNKQTLQQMKLKQNLTSPLCHNPSQHAGLWHRTNVTLWLVMRFDFLIHDTHIKTFPALLSRISQYCRRWQQFGCSSPTPVRLEGGCKRVVKTKKTDNWFVVTFGKITRVLLQNEVFVGCCDSY